MRAHIQKKKERKNENSWMQNNHGYIRVDV